MTMAEFAMATSVRSRTKQTHHCSQINTQIVSLQIISKALESTETVFCMHILQDSKTEIILCESLTCTTHKVHFIKSVTPANIKQKH